MAYTAPSTHPNSYIVTSTDWAIQVNNDKFFHGVPNCRVTRTAAQSIPNNTWTAVQWDTKDWDNNSMFATTGAKLICKTAGKYLAVGGAGFTNSSLGSFRGFGIQKNTTTADNGHEVGALVGTTALSAPAARLSASQLISLSTGQFIRMEVIHDIGSALNTSTAGSLGAGGFPCRLSLLWVSS